MLQIILEIFLSIPLLIIKIVEYIPYILSSNRQKELNRKLRTQLSDPSDESSPYKSCFYPRLFRIDEGETNLFDKFERCAQKFKNANLFGTRDIISIENEKQDNEKLIKKYVLGDYKWESYETVYNRVVNFSNGLWYLGLRPKSNAVLFCETRPEWLITALACFRLNITVVTLYATLGVEALKYGLLETCSNVLITSVDQLEKLEKILDDVPSLECIIVIDTPFSDYNINKFAKKDVKMISEVENIGQNIDKNLICFEKAKKEDIAVIMYTSGSTGVPKGVLISHLNLLSSTTNYMKIIGDDVEEGKDTYIAYLPLAHILELNTQLTCLFSGMRIGYSSAATLTDSSTGIKAGDIGDIRLLQPTFMVTVPLILERVFKAVKQKIEQGGIIRKTLFKLAYKQKLDALRDHRQTFILDRIVFKKIAQSFGGKIKSIFCGSSLLNSEVHEFVNVCIAPVRQAYALTETCCGGTAQFKFEFETNVVGSLMEHCQLRLVNWDEGGYRCTDKPNPRGEIHIGGESIAMGYYKLSEKSNEDFYYFNGLRYFATGDIGEILPNGNLKIIDRKKDLVKLQGGEYVALGKVETCLKLISFIDNCCVYANPLYTFCICLICPNMPKLKEFCEQNGIKNFSFAEISKNNKVNELLKKEILAHSLKFGLNRFEIPSKIRLVEEIWLPDTGLVTDSMKLKRKAIEAFYLKQIHELYNY